jgi:ABC-type uncharacterized transport system substrate-binding protein
VLSPDVVKIIFEAVAEKLKITILRYLQLQSPVDETEYRRVFEAMRRDHVDAVLIDPDTENYTHRVLLGRLVREYRLPAICWFSDSVEAGAPMAYTHDLMASARRRGAQIVEILNGGNPAEMRFSQQTRWELVINLRAAKELGRFHRAWSLGPIAYSNRPLVAAAHESRSVFIAAQPGSQRCHDIGMIACIE